MEKEYLFEGSTEKRMKKMTVEVQNLMGADSFHQNLREKKNFSSTSDDFLISNAKLLKN